METCATCISKFRFTSSDAGVLQVTDLALVHGDHQQLIVTVMCDIVHTITS